MNSGELVHTDFVAHYPEFPIHNMFFHFM